MHALASPAEVEARLGALADRPVPYVERLPRRPREHAPRWMHLLGPSAPDVGRGPPADAPPPAAAAPFAPAPVRPSPTVAAPSSGGPSRDAGVEVAEALERIEELESRLASLEDRLDRLEGR